MGFQRKRLVATITAILILWVPQAPACEWAIGYFYQVSNLKGTVVGTNLPLLRSVRSLRQSFNRRRVRLALYDYRWPHKASEMVPLKSVVTDADGNFDFGALSAGHYTLIVEEEKWPQSDWFDVEVKGPSNPKESVTIDISPVTPDCKGGHEFIVNAN
jgi:hypothetical protein